MSDYESATDTRCEPTLDANPNPPTRAELRAWLRAYEDPVTVEMRAAIVRLEDPTPHLIELVERYLDEDTCDEESFELGPSAVVLLGERGDPRAIPVLCCAVEAPLDPFTDPTHDRAIDALVAIGDAALEPVLARLRGAEAAEDGCDDPYAWCEILSRMGIADERIFTGLVRAFPGYPNFIARCFADYGDRRALPLLHDGLGRLRVWGELPQDRWIGEFADAIQRLGDTLTDAERAKLAAARSALEASPASL